MTVTFKPWDKRTDGAPVPVELVVDEGSDGRRAVQNRSRIALFIVRASGKREPLLPMQAAVLDPGETVDTGISRTEPVAAGELSRAIGDGTAEYYAERLSLDDTPPAGSRWWLHRRELPDGRVMFLLPGYSTPRLGVSGDGSSAAGFYSEYCFADWHQAWLAVLGWNGEGDPEGWVRHLNTGRRRPGTPESEVLRW